MEKRGEYSLKQLPLRQRDERWGYHSNIQKLETVVSKKKSFCDISWFQLDLILETYFLERFNLGGKLHMGANVSHVGTSLFCFFAFSPFYCLIFLFFYFFVNFERLFLFFFLFLDIS